MRFGYQNENARINERRRGDKIVVTTDYRDPFTLTAEARVRERNDVETGRSLTGLSLTTRGGRQIRFNGHEARTLFRILSQAVTGDGEL